MSSPSTVPPLPPRQHRRVICPFRCAFTSVVIASSSPRLHLPYLRPNKHLQEDRQFGRFSSFPLIPDLPTVERNPDSRAIIKGDRPPTSTQGPVTAGTPRHHPDHARSISLLLYTIFPSQPDRVPLSIHDYRDNYVPLSIEQTNIPWSARHRPPA